MLVNVSAAPQGSAKINPMGGLGTVSMRKGRQAEEDEEEDEQPKVCVRVSLRLCVYVYVCVCLCVGVHYRVNILAASQTPLLS
jgi:hypothetical protein